MSASRRGRGQRRSRRLKNRTLDDAQKAALYTLWRSPWTPSSSFPSRAAELADLTAYFREDRHGRRDVAVQGYHSIREQQFPRQQASDFRRVES